MKPRKSYLKPIALSAVACLCIALLSFIIIKSEFTNDTTGDGTIYQFTLAKKGNMIDNATCYAWIPPNVGTIRSVIVHLHGCTREDDAHQMMYDIQWRELARKYHSVLLAPKFITGTKCGSLGFSSNGSDGVFPVDAGYPGFKSRPSRNKSRSVDVVGAFGRRRLGNYHGRQVSRPCCYHDRAGLRV